MALTGLSTKFISSVVNTSFNPEGGAWSATASMVFRPISSVGKAKLATTAVKAAKKVPKMYMINTGFTWTWLWPWCWLTAAMTKMNTKIGATAFSAPTNKVPSKPNAIPTEGNNQPIKIPITSPIIIRGTKPMRWYMSIRALISSPNKC